MRFFLFLLSILILGCSRQKSANSPADSSSSSSVAFDNSNENANQITCWGIGEIELGDDMTLIEEKVGKENISYDSLFIEGAFEGMVTKLWKQSPKEITIHWEEKKQPFQNIKFLEISGPDSPYSFTNGIRTGSSLIEIVNLNGQKPVELYGFGWDGGGTFAGFGAGKLAGDLPCFGGVFALRTQKSTQELSKVMGDHKISSADPALVDQEVVLEKIRVINKN